MNNFQIENPSPLFNEDNNLNELNVSNRLSHELQSNESQSINTKKRKEIEEPSVVDEAPKKRLIRRANKDKKGPRFNLDDDDQPSQINTQQQQPSQQLQSSRKRQVGVKGGKSINIDDSDEDEKYNIPQNAGTVNADETNNNNIKLTDPPHPSPSDVNRRIENQKRTKSIGIDNSEDEERQPQQRRTTLKRRAGTIRARSINIDDSDEDEKTGSRKIKEQNIQDTANYDSNSDNNKVSEFIS